MPKGRLLDEIFGREDAIKGSDQGRSFQAFWGYLMSPDSQEELELLMERVVNLPEIKDIVPEGSLESIRFRLIEAGAKVNETCALLVEQLRRFLDDQAWLENRRIMGIIRSIEKTAVSIRQRGPDQKDFVTVEDIRPDIRSPVSRRLFRPPHRPVVDDEPEEGRGEFDASTLFNQHHVDERTLKDRIRRALRGRSQISLSELCEQYPVEKGLSEVVAYLDLACKDNSAMVDTEKTQAIYWTGTNSKTRMVHMPMVIFTA
jgi:hypothetical protein